MSERTEIEKLQGEIWSLKRIAYEKKIDVWRLPRKNEGNT